MADCARAMLIVPDDDQLVVEVKASPADIDQIRPGQKTMLRFAAFNQRTTPEVPGSGSNPRSDSATSKLLVQ